MNTEKKHQAFNKGLVILAWIIIAGGIIFLVNYYIFSNQYNSTNNAQVDQYITPISSRVPGFITQVNFKENQFVHQGDTLIIIDNREYTNKVNMAQADLSSTTDGLKVNQTEVNAQQSQIAIQQSRLAAAKVQVWKTEKDYLRYKNLVAQEAATAQQFEQVKAAYEIAQAQLQTILVETNSALLKSKATQTQAKPVQSAINGKAAQLNNASLYLSYTVITAPYDGWVGKKNIQIGQLVKEGQTLVHVVSEEKWITANFRETQIEALQIGTPVLIKADAYPNLAFKGKISSFSPATGAKFSILPQDNSTGNFVKIEQRIPVRIEFLPGQKSDHLRAGMNVVVSAQQY